MVDSLSHPQLELLLEMASAEDAVSFWALACELLSSVTPFRLAVVYSKESAILLKPDTRGVFKVVAGSNSAALDLRVGSVYNYINRILAPTVKLIEVDALRRAPQHGHPFLSVDRCDELITLVFMVGTWVCADIALYRNATDRSAAPRPVEQLDRVYEAVKRRVLQHWRTTRREALETGITDFLRELPIGLAFFSWELDLLYANDEAYRQSHVWNSAPDARPIKRAELRDVFKIAPEIHRAWETLRYERALSLARLEPMERTQLSVLHPRVPNLKAVVGITMDQARPLRTPNFVVRFSAVAVGAGVDAFELTTTQLSVLAELTPAERAVAVLAMRGLDNQTIAAQLHREVSTVKDHLTRIYAKLGLKSRAQLASLKGSV